jgi:hypothetical protein
LSHTWRLIWTVWTIAAGGSFILLEFLALVDRKNHSVTLSEFGWYLMRNEVVNAIIIAFLVFLLIHFAYKGRIL